MGLIVKGNGVQAVYGPKADVLKSDIQDLLDSGVDIPKTDVTAPEEDKTADVSFKGVTEEVATVADGQVLPITQVHDPVFSQK